MYGGGASVGAYSRLYSGMYDDDTCNDDRVSSPLVGGDEAAVCARVSCDSITPLDTIIMNKTANVINVKNDIDCRKIQNSSTYVASYIATGDSNHMTSITIHSINIFVNKMKVAAGGKSY